MYMTAFIRSVAYLRQGGVMRNATALFVLAIVAVVAGLLSGHVAVAAPSQLVAVNAQLFAENGLVVTRVTVTNTADAVASSIDMSDAYGNRHQLGSVQPGDTEVIDLHTRATAVMGYTVNVVVRTSDGRMSARGYQAQVGTLDLRPAPQPVVPQYPDRYCDGDKTDVLRCFTERVFPRGI